MIGAEGPLTPTGLAERLMMPLSTVIFRVRRLERRGHAERVPTRRRPVVPDPADAGRATLLGKARPVFRCYAEAVEARLGADRVDVLTEGLAAVRQAIDEELAARKEPAPKGR